MGSLRQMTAILFILITWFSVIIVGCDVDDVAVYKVKLRTLWSEDTFPKDYPRNPKAQWSQGFGQSHNRSYALYRMGEIARPVVRDFAQFGTLEQLMEEGEEEPKVYDQFTTPAMDGVAETENMVFVDGGHSLVSMMCRMIPSPDWFIGVDSLNLCVDSSWVDQVTLDLDPLDAGTVNGLTYLEMPWPTDPLETVAKVSSRHQNFLNSSFYYRRWRQLPAIAKVELTKVKEYSTKELNEFARKELISKLVPQKYKNRVSKTVHSKNRDEDLYYKQDESFKSEIDNLKDLEEEPVGTPKPGIPKNNVIVVRNEQASLPELDSSLRSMDEVVLAVANGRRLGLGKHLPRHFKSRLHHAVNRRRRS